MKRLSSTLKMLDNHDDFPSPKKVLSICSLLELMAKPDEGIDCASFCKTAVAIACAKPTEIYIVIKRLTVLNILELSGKDQTNKISDCIIKIADSKNFLKAIKKTHIIGPN
jgi:hypothetical protein